MVQIDKDNFTSRVLEAKHAVVADFWAPWCGYCRRLAPAFDRIAAEYGEAADFVKINIDDNDALAEKYSVETIPTLMIFVNGEVKARAINPSSQAEIAGWLTEHGVVKA